MCKIKHVLNLRTSCFQDYVASGIHHPTNLTKPFFQTVFGKGSHFPPYTCNSESTTKKVHTSASLSGSELEPDPLDWAATSEGLGRLEAGKMSCAVCGYGKKKEESKAFGFDQPSRQHLGKLSGIQ